MKVDGAVKTLLPTFGFIRSDSGQEYFFLPNSVEKSTGPEFSQLKVGQRVRFNTVEHPKGMRAVDIQVLA